MVSQCWLIRSCPPDFCYKCRAWQEGQNCWDVTEGCLACNRDCDHCFLYQEARRLGLFASPVPEARTAS